MTEEFTTTSLSSILRSSDGTKSIAVVDRPALQAATPAPNVELTPLVISLIVVLCILVVALIVSSFILRMCIIKRRDGRTARAEATVKKQTQQVEAKILLSPSKEVKAKSTSTTTPTTSYREVQTRVLNQRPNVTNVDASQRVDRATSPGRPRTSGDKVPEKGLLLRRMFVYSHNTWRTVDEAPEFSFEIDSESASDISLNAE
uniref:Uncharacterized protein n=1 Tax=Parascaris univalens TaxID=6257 RepID=A0A915AWZ5_PARUN